MSRRPTSERLQQIKNNFCVGDCDACEEKRELLSEIDALTKIINHNLDEQLYCERVQGKDISDLISERDQLKAENESKQKLITHLEVTLGKICKHWHNEEKENATLRERNAKLEQRIEKLREALTIISKNSETLGFGNVAVRENVKRALSEDNKER